MNNLVFFALCFIPPMLLGFWAQHSVKRNFAKYLEVRSSSGLTGAQIARQILDRNGLSSVPVVETPGELSDHYDPRSRSVNLSPSVYRLSTISSVSVAAHEVGHAIQHAKSYVPMTARSALWPVVAFGQNTWQIILIAGIVIMTFAKNVAFGTQVIQFAIILFAFVVLFQVITLPVEFDASRRAKKQLNELGLIPSNEAAGTSTVLRAAAMTYVAGALASVAMLFYYVMTYMGNRD